MEIYEQKLNPQKDHFDFFQLLKNYAKLPS